MKYFLFSLVAGLVLMGFTTPHASAAENAWLTDLPGAQAAATERKQVILADFTGSDWCGWCIKLKKEVFNTPEFAAWAKQHVVLLEVDFPQQKELPAVQERANRALAERFNVEGFPTIVLMRADGSEAGRLGYQKGGPKAWIAAAEKILAQPVPKT